MGAVAPARAEPPASCVRHQTHRDRDALMAGMQGQVVLVGSAVYLLMHQADVSG